MHLPLLTAAWQSEPSQVVKAVADTALSSDKLVIVFEGASFSNATDLIQAAVALISLVLLFKTLSLSKTANEHQQRMIALEIKAKRGEYFPSYNVELNIKPSQNVLANPSHEFDWDEFLHLECRIIIIDKVISNLDYKFTRPSEKAFKVPDKSDLSKTLYKRGDEVSFVLFDFQRGDLERGRNVGSITLEFSFEDIIGNAYIHILEYDLRTVKIVKETLALKN